MPAATGRGTWPSRTRTRGCRRSARNRGEQGRAWSRPGRALPESVAPGAAPGLPRGAAASAGGSLRSARHERSGTLMAWGPVRGSPSAREGSHRAAPAGVRTVPWVGTGRARRPWSPAQRARGFRGPHMPPQEGFPWVTASSRQRGGEPVRPSRPGRSRDLSRTVHVGAGPSRCPAHTGTRPTPCWRVPRSAAYPSLHRPRWRVLSAQLRNRARRGRAGASRPSHRSARASTVHPPRPARRDGSRSLPSGSQIRPRAVRTGSAVRTRPVRRSSPA